MRAADETCSGSTPGLSVGTEGNKGYSVAPKRGFDSLRPATHPAFLTEVERDERQPTSDGCDGDSGGNVGQRSA